MRGQERRTRLLVVREHERFEHARHCRLLNSFGATTNRHNTRTAVLQYRRGRPPWSCFGGTFPKANNPSKTESPTKDRQAGLRRNVSVTDEYRSSQEVRADRPTWLSMAFTKCIIAKNSFTLIVLLHFLPWFACAPRAGYPHTPQPKQADKQRGAGARRSLDGRGGNVLYPRIELLYIERVLARSRLQLRRRCENVRCKSIRLP
jgi:hypothetical protein